METPRSIPDDYTGPVVLHPERLEQIGALADSVFRGGRPGVMAATYPLLFDRGRMDQLRVFTFQGKPVSLAGVLIRDLVLGGCEVRAAMLGSVCTDAAHRGKGLADHLLSDTIDHARRQGATVMIISGGRGLYIRRGARTTGHLLEVILPADAIDPPERLVYEEVGAANASIAQRLIETEPVRYRWWPQAFRAVIESGHAADQPAQTFLVRAGARGDAVALITAQIPRTDAADAPLAVVEFAGSRTAVLAAATTLARRHQRKTLRLVAQPGDPHMADLIATHNATTRSISLDATVKILDFKGLWRSILPLIRERIGNIADQIEIEEQWTEGNLTELRMSLNDDTFVIRDPQAIVDLLFGKEPLAAWDDAPATLAEVLKPAFPLPLPAYGLSYT